MAAPIGNQNAVKAKEWTAAVKRALARRGNGDYHAGLNSLADKLLDKAEEGDLAALRELGDRIEGKPAQVIAGDEQNPLVTRSLEAVGVPAARVPE